MNIIDTVTDCTTNDLRTTTPTTNSFDGTTSLARAIAEDLKLCSISNTEKISRLTKEACTALSLPIDTKGQKKPPADALAIYEWLKSKYATQPESTNQPTVEPVTPAEEITEIEPVEVLPVPEVTTNSTTVDLFGIDTTLETENVNMPIGINAISALPDMTLAEAQTKHAELKSVHSLARTMLLEMRDRKGWLALGYSSFSDYGEKEWGYTQSYISRLTTAAAIQEKLNMPIGINEIPESHTRELGNLPNDDAMREVYDRVTAENEKVTAKAIQDAVNEWKAKHDAVQNDLLAVRQQNDDLRGNIDAKVSAAISTEQAALVVESSAAMQALQKQISDAKDALEKKERENEKAIAEGIKHGLSAMQNEIDTKQYQIDSFNKRIDALREVELSKERGVGALQTHKKVIEKIKDNLSFLAVSFSDAFDTNVIPAEVFTDWQQIRTNIKKLDSKMDEFFADNAPIDGAVLVAEVVTL